MSSPAPSEPVRLGHIGVGRWGANLLRNTAASSGFEVVAVCDPRDPALAAAARLAPEARTFRDADGLLALDEVEAVVIAVETPLHYATALAALTAGKHVFVEKPLAQTAAEAERLVTEARRRDLRLMVGHLLRYHPAFRHVEGLAAGGALGDVRYVYSVRVNLGVVRDRENAFDSLAPHDLAVARALIPGRPVAVSAQGQAFLRPGVEDVVFATVSYEGGALAHLHCSWLDPHKVRRTTVVGSEKMATVDDMEPAEKVRVYDKGVDPAGEAGYASFAGAVTVRSGDIVVPRVAPAEPLRVEVEEFAAAVREARPALTDGEDGLEVVRVLEAARRSLREGGGRVEIAAGGAPG